MTKIVCRAHTRIKKIFHKGFVGVFFHKPSGLLFGKSQILGKVGNRDVEIVELAEKVIYGISIIGDLFGVLADIFEKPNAYKADKRRNNRKILCFKSFFKRFKKFGSKLRRKILKISNTRATLIPPPVEPAQAPITISISKIPLEKLGHRS